MKRFLVACAAALALVAFSGQQASAHGGGGFRIGFGVSIGFDASCTAIPACPSPCMGPAGGYMGIADCGYGGGYGGYHCAAPSYAPSYAPPTHVATTPAPAPTQQVGYQGYPSAQGYYPVYWYGN